jgi:alpha-mannosidase
MENKQINVFLVNHTHWDREWYFSDQDSLTLSALLFKDAIIELEEHPEVSFTLDGQTSILDDFLRIYPHWRDRVQKLVMGGQLKIGPWYTQPDALHVQGESLLRNGIIGQQEAMQLGGSMKVGYLPDTFGFNSQMPVVLNELGLSKFVFWRGIDPQKTGGFYFQWNSLGNGRHVTAVNMPQGYGTGMLLEDTRDYVDRRLDAGVDFIRDQSARPLSNVLIPTGNDQMSIIHGFSEKVNAINKMGKYHYQVSDYEHFFDYLPKQLPEYSGEFIDPVYARVHRSCGSSRVDIKLAATALEDKLLHQVEPLMVIGMQCGINLGNELLINAWKKLLESQAHDSMAGSVVDAVAADILHRIKQGNELADGIINTIEKMIAQQLKLEENEVLLLNPLPKESVGPHQVRVLCRNQNVSFDGAQTNLISQEYIKPRKNVLKQLPSGDEYVTEPGYYVSKYLVEASVPALGYRVLTFEANTEPLIANQSSSDLKIDGKNYELQFSDGHLILTYSDGTMVRDFIKLADRGNDGDTYDYSPLPGDQTITMKFDQANMDTIAQYPTMHLNGKAKLPRNLEQRQQNIRETEISYQLSLMQLPDEHLQCTLNFENSVLDHQVTLVIDTGVTGERVIASVPYGYMQRSEKAPDDWLNRYTEKPIAYWPLDNNLSLYNGQHGLTVFTTDIKEYRQTNSQLKLTLFATTGQLGKPDLVNRPGRASGDTTKVGHPMLPTPQAELTMSLQYRFQIFFDSAFDGNRVEQQREQEEFSVLSYQKQDLNLFLNRLDNKIQDDLLPNNVLARVLTVFEIPESICVSACYPSFRSADAFIIRLVNPTQRSVMIDLPAAAQCVNALEAPIKNEGVIKPYDVLSLKLKLD